MVSFYDPKGDPEKTYVHIPVRFTDGHKHGQLGLPSGDNSGRAGECGKSSADCQRSEASDRAADGKYNAGQEQGECSS